MTSWGDANASSIDDIARRLSINSDNSISWFDEVAIPSLQVADELIPEALHSHVSDLLYTAYYVYGVPRPISALKNDSPVLSSNAGFVQDLMSSYRGGSSWLPAFEEESDSDLTLWGVRYVKPELYSDDHSRYLPTALPMRSPGYVLFVGECGPGRQASADARSTRVYWNVSRAGALELVSSLTELLNAQKEPFQFKIAHSAATWPERADVGVLYLPADRLTARWDAIISVYEKIHTEIRAWCPAFTRRIAPGLAIADDPPGGLSFGQTVARVLAQGLYDDHAERGERSTRETRADQMREALAASGRDVTRVHLNLGSEELELDLPPDPLPVNRRFSKPGTVSQASREAVEERVTVVADVLARHAITAGSRCTWLTRKADSADSHALESTGPELYDGLSGIALFLAHAYAVIGKEQYADLAEMSALNTIDNLRQVGHHHGLYGGRTGAAAAVNTVGRTLGRPGLQAAGLAYLLDEGDDDTHDDVPRHDLIYGISGSVLSYCWAACVAGSGRSRRSLLDRADGLAALLVSDLAERSGRQVGLPGLAHGPSSSVLALSVLGRLRGGVARLDDAVASAADHERAAYDAERENWPGGPSGASESRFNWCYGAPGIAIARLACLGRVASAASDLEIAVRRVNEVGVHFLGRAADPSACHGKLSIAGVIDLVQRTSDSVVDVGLKNQLLDEALDHYGDERVARLSPGLMAGAAGSGLAGLRECRPDTVCSPLFPMVPFLGKDFDG